MTEHPDFRLLLVMPFCLPPGSRFLHRPIVEGAKEQRLMNYALVEPLLADTQWDIHRGEPAPYGDWPVGTQEEFALIGASGLSVIREACGSGLYNGIVLLGGGDPGYVEAREIGKRHGIPVTACGYAQMHVALTLGSAFSVLDIAETHSVYYRNLVRRYGLADRCASLRTIEYPLPRPGEADVPSLDDEKKKALRGEDSEALELALKAVVAAIEEDGAEVITIGCSALFWMQPFLKRRLADIGWDVPVLEGYSCAIALAKMMISLGVDASGLLFPSARPARVRHRKWP